MGLAVALFHWAPATFWGSTPHEYYAAWEGWREVNTVPDED